jgi:replicative DNA helicase
MAKLECISMAQKHSTISEGEALDGFLDELQQAREVKEISGWDSGFVNLNGALDGILPGLYLLIGPPGGGKTSFAKQLLDQVALRNDTVGLFFSFSESKKKLRIKTLARLSGIESREIRRGSAYLLHWYGTPRLAGQQAEQLSPSWEKVKRCAEEARAWLDSIFLLECGPRTTVEELEKQTREIVQTKNKENPFIVIDDCQRLLLGNQSLQVRLPLLTEQLAGLARNMNAALLAIWPDLSEDGRTAPQAWAERALGADVIMVLEQNPERANELSESAQPMNLHVVKNRAGERGTIAFDFRPAFARFTESHDTEGGDPSGAVKAQAPVPSGSS